MQLSVDDHPLLGALAFETVLPAPLAELQPPGSFEALRQAGGPAPVARDEARRKDVRDLLRHGGYKPTGRGKPSSEYLLKAAAEGGLRSINLAVDAGNIASLHSGIPISVIDLGHAVPPLRLGIAPADTSYVFNPSGQEIDVSGLLCLFDAEGPCANAVKDAQRTKTSEATLRTLSVLWAPASAAAAARETCAWYRDLLAACGATTSTVL